ncbi:MAG: winged helix-turn-helix transcriptional regulator [Candidatus Lokiarchaeota archaeon]|nr:winged helix-turn-helix transcriptional regulator [Candidatus Lokiarchaeota archaeon]
MKVKLQDLSETDKKILSELIENSNRPYRVIAEKVGTTKQNISQRIKKLTKEKKIINSFTIKIKDEIIDELNVKAYILLREDPDTKIREQNEKLIKAIPQITTFSRLFGKYDGIIEVIVKDNEELKEIMSKLHKFSGIKETETFIVHANIKNEKNSPILNLLK